MRLRMILLSAAVAVPAGSMLGGWAVVTVENPPERLVVGTPYTLEYSVRQHGRDLLNDLYGIVEARAGGQVVRATAKPIGIGKYSASVTVPSSVP